MKQRTKHPLYAKINPHRRLNKRFNTLSFTTSALCINTLWKYQQLQFVCEFYNIPSNVHFSFSSFDLCIFSAPYQAWRSFFRLSRHDCPPIKMKEILYSKTYLMMYMSILTSYPDNQQTHIHTFEIHSVKFGGDSFRFPLRSILLIL